MKEEKSMKHWLKQKVTFTQALLVAFLITGGIGFAETTLEQLTKRVEALEKNAVHYTSIKSEESQNKNNDGAKAKDSIAIGAKAGTHVNATSAVAIGDTAKANGEAALAFGRKSTSDGKGSIAIGDEAKIASNGHSLTSIAIGKKAYVLNGTGQQEYELSFDKNNWTVTPAGFFSNTYTPKVVDKVPGGIAIGTNSYARTGSVQIGAHTVSKGSMMGGKAFVGDENANIVGMTTIGTNSYNKGALATVAGAYSIITGDFTGQGGLNSLLYGSQNFGAVTMGSLNSIRSRGYNGTAGVANSIVGLANVAENSNGALIFGAGNNISNSMKTINGVSTGADSVDDMVKQLQTAVKDSNSGGATLAIGGGNKADYTQASQLIGVNNTLTGKSGKESKYALLNGYKNTATNVENTYVTGTENTVTESESVSVIGKGNKVTNSDRQNVFGDNNTIENRDAGTVSGYDGKTKRNGTFDLVVGMGNKITGNDTYMTGKESLTVIGNNNKLVNPSSAIVIGDNQKLSAIKNTVVIGTMNKEGEDVEQKHNSVVVGYNARSGTKDSGGMNIAVGYGAEALGWLGTVTGYKSIITSSENHFDSIYGVNNTIAGKIGFSSGIIGSWNKIEDSTNSMVFGSGNKITNAFVESPVGEAIYELSARSQYGEIYSDNGANTMSSYTTMSGGSIATLGNGNTADYAIRSQILGTGNILTGTKDSSSAMNSINGYQNIGKNIKNMSLIGTGNSVTDASAGIIIGDYHELTGGKNNIILGGMETKEEEVTKTYTPSLGKSEARPDGYTGIPMEYKVKIQVPVKKHTANISNAVMIGYNTDVQKDGGIALGSESVADRDKGKVGYDALNEKHDEDMTGTWKSTAAALSVGEKDKTTRQITNVAAGTEDTDAVNVAQLKALNQKMDKNTIHYVSVKSNEKGADSNYFNDGAKEKDSIVVGIHSTSSGVNSAVFGNYVKLTGVKNGRNNSIVVGHHIGAEGTHNAIFATDYHNYDHKTTHVFGEANTVLGVGNLVGWTAEKDSSDPTKWIYTKKGSGSDQNVAVGLTNTVNGGSIVVGTSSTSESLGSSFGHGNTIIGMDNDGGQRGLALGNDLKVKGEEAVAIGTESEATSDWTIAVGKKSKAEKTQDMAMGYQATASGGWSIAFGGSSSAEKQTALALGYGSHAKVDGGIALGSFSIADRAGFDSMKKAPYSNFNLADKTLGAVSVGGNGKLRQIINVGDATEETDAVNLRQLNALKNTVSGISQLNFAGDNNSTGSVNLATEALKLSGAKNQITTKADGNGLAIALDKKVTDKLDSIGTGKIEKGDNNTVTGDTVYHAIKEQIDDVEKGDITSNTLSITGGVDKVFGEDVSIELKEKSVTKAHLSDEVTNILNKVGDGVIAKDGEKSDHTVTGKTVYEYLEKQKEEIGVDLSNKANKDASNIEVDKFTEKLNEGANIAEPKDRLVTDRQVKDYVAGTEIAYRAEEESDSKKVKLSDGFVFQGDNNIQTETKANGVVKHTLNSELTGIKSISNEGTTITWNKENISVNDKKITGVADGDLSATSQDAVNGRQLYETNGRVERLEKDSETMKEHIVENTRQIERAKSETRHVGALSSALAALHPMQYDPLQKNQVMAGVGTYRDKQAVAVGLTHYFNENLMMTAGVSIGEAERVKTMANVGITWKIGKDDDRRDLPERYKEGPISSIYKMQQEMEEVLKENQEQKIKIQKQQEQINKMQEQLEMLLKQK
ncbi:YadA-like family protein [Fusobacterium necrophorum]|uniref:YadA-like family protein n=1 Tax=Fusobacterium necrophorum TaxID=859 RepID=UPI00370F3654